MKKTTQNTEAQLVSYILANDWDGTIYDFNNLTDAFTALGDFDLFKWYDSRDYIPAKSNFYIQKVVNGNATTIITKVKAKILFNQHIDTASNNLDKWGNMIDEPLR